MDEGQNKAPYGYLFDYATDEPIRPATEQELAESENAPPTGVFELDGRSVYVDEV